MDPRRVIRALKTPVTMLILVALVGFAAKWGLDAVRAPVPPRPPEPCVVTTVGSKFTPKLAVVRVLNGTGENGVARRVATTLRADQFRVIKIANADAEQANTTIVGYSAKSPEVVLVKGFFKKAKVVADKRVDHTVDVIIGKDYDGLRPKPKLWVALPDKKACLPQIEVVDTSE